VEGIQIRKKKKRREVSTLGGSAAVWGGTRWCVFILYCAGRGINRERASQTREELRRNKIRVKKVTFTQGLPESKEENGQGNERKKKKKWRGSG